MPTYRLWSGEGYLKAAYNNITNVVYQGSRIVYLYGPRPNMPPNDATRLVAIVCMGDCARLEASSE
jgi:hypothetical protein